MTDGTETTAVRPAHRIDEARLAEYLRPILPDTAGPLSVTQFGYGQSNPTYVLRFGETEYVLRKQPPGELLPSAHAVDREYRVQAALHPTGFPVPRPLHFCADREVVGTPFYVMERMRGRVFTANGLPGVPPDERRAMYVSLAETLAKLHTTDVAAVGLTDFGRPGNYYERQFNRWAGNYAKTGTRDMPDLDRLIEWLPAHMPPDEGEASVVHGDYRMGNVMFHPTEPRIVAVFDWELATLGHPLSDLAYCCILWHTTADEFGGVRGLDLAAEGIPTQDEFVEIYRRAANRADGLTPAHLAHAMFRFAAILDGVRARGLAGNAAADNAEEVGRLALVMAERGWQAAEGARPTGR